MDFEIWIKNYDQEFHHNSYFLFRRDLGDKQKSNEQKKHKQSKEGAVYQWFETLAICKFVALFMRV